MLRKLTTAFTALIAATDNYWQQNKKDDYPTLPEDQTYADALHGARQVLEGIETKFAEHITKAGELYEETKQHIMHLQADALAGVKLEDIPGKLENIFKGMQQLRDLACSLYEPEAWKAVHETTE